MRLKRSLWIEYYRLCTVDISHEINSGAKSIQFSRVGNMLQLLADKQYHSLLRYLAENSNYEH